MWYLSFHSLFEIVRIWKIGIYILLFIDLIVRWIDSADTFTLRFYIFVINPPVLFNELMVEHQFLNVWCIFQFRMTVLVVSRWISWCVRITEQTYINKGFCIASSWIIASVLSSVKSVCHSIMVNFYFVAFEFLKIFKKFFSFNFIFVPFQNIKVWLFALQSSQ